MSYRIVLVSIAIATPLLLYAPMTPAGPVDTNRPGFSFSPNVVGTGVWQLETGVDYSRSEGGLRTLELPNAELRYGIDDRVEVFVAGLNWIDADLGASSASGFSDLQIGTKIGLVDANSPTRLAMLFLVSAPTGDDAFTSDSWDPKLGLVWSTAGKLPLAGTVTVTEQDGKLRLDNGLKLPFTLNERQSMFVEWEANVPESGSTTHFLNSGFQWLLDDATQLDAGLDLGLDKLGDDYRFGVGFSRRF